MTEAKTHKRNVVQIYLATLEKEKKKPDTRGERGMSRGPRRRAMDATAEQCGYKGYQGVRTAIRRWEDANVPVNFDTMGMELDQEFATLIREQQCKVDAALGATRALAEQVRELGFHGGVLDVYERDLMQEYPQCLCTHCKGAVDDCEACGGRSWMTGRPMEGEADPRLLDTENIHVAYKGKIVPLDEVPQ